MKIPRRVLVILDATVALIVLIALALPCIMNSLWGIDWRNSTMLKPRAAMHYIPGMKS